jgi:hypothetical protein
LIITLVFKKNANFFAENCEKSQKIVIITSTPDWAKFCRLVQSVCRSGIVSDCQPRVARWYSFKPKKQMGVNFGGFCNGRCWYILRQLGIFYGHLVYFVAIWYILWPFGIFFRFGMSNQEKSGNLEPWYFIFFSYE